MTILYGPILVVEDTPNVLELLDVTLRFKGNRSLPLESLPPDQQPAFQELLNSAINDRDQIQEELDILFDNSPQRTLRTLRRKIILRGPQSATSFLKLLK